MSVLENFKNIPRSPYGGATGPKCNFFPSNLQPSPWPKKRGGCRPPSGDRVTLPYIRPPPSFPPHLSSKNPPKIQKKERGEEK